MDSNIHGNKIISFFKHEEKCTSAYEEEYIENIISESEKDREELSYIHKLIDLDNKIKQIQSFNLEKEYQALNSRIQKRSNLRLTYGIFSKYAAILVLPLMLTTLWFLYQNNIKGVESKESMIEVSSMLGSITKVTLPDGSVVSLNYGSKVKYPAKFTQSNREVFLEGEGYFEVISNSDNPFYVTTKSGIQVKAYGTKFNVNAVSTAEQVEAILEKGHIDIEYKENKLATVSPGEEAIYNSTTKSLIMNRVNLIEKLAWKDGMIVFRNGSMNEIIEQLSKRYNVDVILHDPQNKLKDFRCRVKFKDETLQQILSYLELAAPIKWKINGSIQNDDLSISKQQIEIWLN